MHEQFLQLRGGMPESNALISTFPADSIKWDIFGKDVEMLRYVFAGFFLIVFVLWLGRYEMSHVNVGMGQSLHDTLNTVASVKSKIEIFNYENKSLPKANQDIGIAPPDQFTHKSPLIKHVEVLRDGLLFVQFTAENKGIPVELVLRPERQANAKLFWRCESYNMTPQWTGVMTDPCVESAAPFDRESYLQHDPGAYVTQVMREQRVAEPKKDAQFPECDAGTLHSGFVEVTSEKSTAWSVADLSKPIISVARNQSSLNTPAIAVGDFLLGYALDRVRRVHSNYGETVSDINLINTSRWRWIKDRIWMNSGSALISVNPCEPDLKVDKKYFLDLGTYSRITDFLVQDGLGILATEATIPGSNESAIQVVNLDNNRVVGFLKLDGRANGLDRYDRNLYVANGTQGIAVLDIFDIMNPRLVRRVVTRDAAMDVMASEGHLALADRMGGVMLYDIQDDNLNSPRAINSEIAAIQINSLENNYVSVSGKDGNTSLWRWQNGNLISIK